MMKTGNLEGRLRALSRCKRLVTADLATGPLGGLSVAHPDDNIFRSFFLSAQII